MAKTKVTLKWNGSLKPFAEGSIVDTQTASLIGTVVETMSKRVISTGLSPVLGVGRFVPYVGQGAFSEITKLLKEAQKRRFTRLSESAKRAQSANLKKLVARQRSAAMSQAKAQADRIKNRFYPYSAMKKYPDKKVKPVNLYLDGSFLDTLTHAPRPNGIEFGHLFPDAKTKDLFEAHNEGLNKYVPQRKYLPNKKGELFIVSIMRAIRNVYSQRIKSIINSNR